jgi:hypothetical protein
MMSPYSRAAIAAAAGELGLDEHRQAANDAVEALDGLVRLHAEASAAFAITAAAVARTDELAKLLKVAAAARRRSMN